MEQESMTQPEHEAGSREAVVQLPEELTIAQSGEFYRRFTATLDRGGDITLDGAAVTRIDAAFIQLLYQVHRELSEARHSLQWLAVSPAIRRSVELLGMSEQLALPEDAG